MQLPHSKVTLYVLSCGLFLLIHCLSLQSPLGPVYFDYSKLCSSAGAVYFGRKFSPPVQCKLVSKQSKQSPLILYCRTRQDKIFKVAGVTF